MTLGKKMKMNGSEAHKFNTHGIYDVHRSDQVMSGDDADPAVTEHKVMESYSRRV